MPNLETWQWALGLACAFMMGVAKTGVPGLGTMIVPLMVLLVGDARKSAGYTLPLLCLADVFAVFYWRKRAQVSKLFSLIPSTVVGMALGAFALGWNEKTLRPIVGVIVLAMLALYLRRRLRPDTFTVSSHSAPYGITAGFATTVANAAAPVMSLYLLSKKLEKEEFIATGAWFFFVINLSKLPIYGWRGLIGVESLKFDLAMAPLVVCGALTGKWVVKHIPGPLFETLIVGLTVVATVLLFL